MFDGLIGEFVEARASDLAERFGVSPGTVARSVQRLARDGLVESKPYRAIFLTAEGKELAKRAGERHRLIIDFLVAVGVAPHAAEVDTEGIEHHVAKDALDAFRRFLSR